MPVVQCKRAGSGRSMNAQPSKLKCVIGCFGCHWNPQQQQVR